MSHQSIGAEWGPLDNQDSYANRRKDPLQPEKDMWATVLKDAFMCLQGKGKGFSSKRQAMYQASRDRTWILSPSWRPGSFNWVCCVLGLDPGAMLEEISEFLGWRIAA